MPSRLIERETIKIIPDALESEIVTLANGNFAILWATDADTGAGATAGVDILMQLYNPLGEPIGDPILAAPAADNDYANNQNFSVVARGNKIVLAYESDNEFGVAIRATELGTDVDGNVEQLGTIIVAHPNIATPNSNPVVSFSSGPNSTDPTDEGHGFAVNYMQSSGGGDLRLVGHFVTTAGAWQVSQGQNQVSSSVGATDGIDAQTSSATLSDGNMVYVANSSSVSGDTIVFRIVENDGFPEGPATTVPGTANNGLIEEQADVAALANGGFVVTWRSIDEDGVSKVRFQLMDNEGEAVGDQGMIEGVPDYYDMREPTIAALPDGGFIIVQIDETAGSPSAIFAHTFDEDGISTGTQKQVHLTSNTLSDLEVEVLPDGRAIISWASESSNETKVESKVYDTEWNVIEGNPGVDDILVALEKASHVHGDGAFHDANDGADDTLYAVGVGDTLYGGHGDDTLISGEGQDVMFGGAGFDVVSYARSDVGVEVFLASDGAGGGSKGFAEADMIYQVEGLIGSEFDDHLLSDSAGGAMLKGQEGNDELLVFGGGNTAFGGKGDDELFDKTSSGKADVGQDTLFGGQGDDTINLGSGVNTARGEDGDDTFVINMASAMKKLGPQFFFDSENAIDGGAGNDTIKFGEDGFDAGVVVDLTAGTIERGKSADKVNSIEDVFGTVFADTIKGGADANMLAGDGGDDIMFGEGGDDNLFGGTGADKITGGAGSDDMFGGAGNDKMLGGSGRDDINGGSGSDILKGQSGHDVIHGDAGADKIVSGKGNDFAYGGSGKDVIRASQGQDKIFGGGGRDKLKGGSGDDLIFGGKGRDKIVGGGGSDQIEGGKGGDHFIFKKAGQSATDNPDVISDFGRGNDRIDLRDLVDVDLKFKLDGNFAKNGASLTSKEKGNGDTVIRIDVDGDRSADMKLVLSDFSGLSESDFLI